MQIAHYYWRLTLAGRLRHDLWDPGRGKVSNRGCQGAFQFSLHPPPSPIFPQIGYFCSIFSNFTPSPTRKQFVSWKQRQVTRGTRKSTAITLPRGNCSALSMWTFAMPSEIFTPPMRVWLCEQWCVLFTSSIIISYFTWGGGVLYLGRGGDQGFLKDNIIFFHWWAPQFTVFSEDPRIALLEDYSEESNEWEEGF